MNTVIPRKQPAYFLFATLSASLIFGIYLACLLFIPDQSVRVVITDTYSPVVEVIVAVILFLVAKQSTALSKRVGFFWMAISLAILAYAMGDICWGILELVLKQTPFPSIADFFYLLYYLLFLIGALLIPMGKISLGKRINQTLDMSIVMLAAILGFWNFLLGPLSIPQNGQSVLGQVILLAYPVGDLMLLWAILAIIYNRPNEILRTTIILLAASLLVMIISDCVYSYQAMIGVYTSGGILDAAYILSVLICGLAGVHHISTTNRQKKKETLWTERAFPVWIRGFYPWMPYLWLISAYILLINSGLVHMTMSFSSMAVVVGGIIGLVLFRQAVTLYENHNLNVQLEKSLQITQSQANKLELWNQKLQAEIMERERIETILSYDALYDRLTGLPNRSLLLDRLTQVIEYNKRKIYYPFSVLFLDLDSFKIINDSLGHTMGDKLLVLVGKRIQGCLRSGDTVARIGGDEFVVLLEKIGEENTTPLVIQRIQHTFSLPFDVDGTEIFTSASIGVVQSVVGYNNADDVLRDADMAMYRAKQAGKSRFELFEDSMRTQAVSRLAVENELRSGLKNHEFRVYYQPIFEVDSRKLVGFEALLRWLHPKRGLLLPSEFLIVAEESGVIISLEDWVINEVCAKLLIWQDQYAEMGNLTVSVNISDKCFKQSDFVEKIENALRNSGLKAQSLILEITENVLITNYTKANEIFTRLNKLGVQLQIDDFGTGYSSISYLKHFPIGAIKIDKSFINEMNKTRQGQGLVHLMVSMTQQLGMQCIAEGIETEEQLRDLETMMCSFGQGNLLSKPLDEDAAERVLANGLVLG